jgi:hypothetical protein
VCVCVCEFVELAGQHPPMISAHCLNSY